MPYAASKGATGLYLWEEVTCMSCEEEDTCLDSQAACVPTKPPSGASRWLGCPQ